MAKAVNGEIEKAVRERMGSRTLVHYYYIVFGPVHMFLQLEWGGIYIDKDAAAAKIRDCFLLAYQIISASKAVFKVSNRIIIVCSDFHGNYLEIPDQDPQMEKSHIRDPAEVLNQALQWLRSNVEK
jgi:hypothetical protein